MDAAGVLGEAKGILWTYDEEGSTIYEQPGGAGFEDDESTAENIGMFQGMGRSEDMLPDMRLYIHLPETGSDDQ
jgi:hypothetical protein